MSKPALGRGLETLMKPLAGQPATTVRITVPANDAPGLRQFLNRGAETNATVEAESNASAPKPTAVPERVPTWVGAVLLAADAVIVGLSTLLIMQGRSGLLQAVGCMGVVAGATLGVLGVGLLARSR